MTIKQEDIEDSVREALLLAGSNENVIFYFPNGPRPKFPYTSLYEVSRQEELNDWTEFDKTDNVNRIFGYREIVYQIDCYGQNSLQEAALLQGNLTKQSVRQKLREKVSISILTLGPPANTTTLVDDEFEQRAGFEITFNVNVEDGSSSDDTGYYDKVEPIEWVNEPTP